MRRILLMWLVFIVSATTVLVATDPIVHLKITKAPMDLAALETALDIYKHRRGHFPTKQEGLDALLGVVMIRVPRDPWGQPWAYRATEDGTRYVLYSVGVGGRDDGGGGDDVTTTPKRYRCEDYGVNCPPTLRQVSLYGALLAAVVSLILALAFTAAALVQAFTPAVFATSSQSIRRRAKPLGPN